MNMERLNYVFGGLVIAVVVWWFWWRKKEKFGMIKNIRRIPKTTCYNICGQYYNDCMSKFAHVDANACERRRESCLSQCDYTDFMAV